MPDIVGAVLVGMFMALILVMCQIWSMRRRLDAAIELINMYERERS